MILPEQLQLVNKSFCHLILRLNAQIIQLHADLVMSIRFKDQIQVQFWLINQVDKLIVILIHK